MLRLRLPLAIAWAATTPVEISVLISICAHCDSLHCPCEQMTAMSQHYQQQSAA